MPQRLDKALVDAGLVASRARAQDLISQGKVVLDGQAITKANTKLDAQSLARLEVHDFPWVSRAGLKLEAALNAWPDFASAIQGATCVDLGASTGGFTQVLLHAGAAQVLAIDVGQDQLHPSLRHDPRVLSLEQTNCRHLTRQHIPEHASLAVCDVSFISLGLALPATLALLPPDAWLMALIKPQFEVGPSDLGKGGVVRNVNLLPGVLEKIKIFLAQHNWKQLCCQESPVLGPDGNREFLCLARKSG